MGVHALVTGLNGAGKTLFTVATKLRPLVGQTVEYKGETLERRLVVGGIRDLLLPHVVMDVPELDPESWRDEWADKKRDPGTEPVPDVLCSILNWWLWCMPGDVIVVDECQRVFRPMASGKRIPMFISKLETARHYGVEFIYLTQHPQLLHMNVRKLVGPHEDVRRIFGSSSTMVYQWDRVSDPDRIAKATSRVWKHDKSAFKLYKSAEMHGKFGQKLPLAVWAVLGGVILLAVVGWTLKERLAARFAPPPSAAAKQAAAASGAGQVDLISTRSNSPAIAVARWPVYDAEPFKIGREPLAGRAVQWEGGYRQGKVERAWFGLLVDGQRVAVVSLAQLSAMGYSWTVSGPCVGSLRFGDLERLVTCARPAQVEQVNAPKPVQQHSPLTELPS